MKPNEEQINSLRIEQFGIIYLVEHGISCHGDHDYLDYRDKEISVEIKRLRGESVM